MMAQSLCSSRLVSRQRRTIAGGAALLLSLAVGCGGDDPAATDTASASGTGTDAMSSSTDPTTSPTNPTSTDPSTDPTSEPTSEPTSDPTTTDTTGPGCPPGTEDCPCDAGACQAPLVCVADVCVAGPPEGCGDGVVNGAEECDDGANNGDTLACKSDCTKQVCGDGFQGPGEGCDDGNQVDDDECNNACVPGTCGDMVVQAPEACDDANADNTDACLDTCVAASCGDGFVHEGVEVCDDGNLDETDECTSACAAAACGDGFVHEGVEACDDGNEVNTDECLDGCVAASCGDGFVHEGVEACDDGNKVNTDACLDGCVAASCGDGFVQAGVEECDDGNKVAGDGCDASCKSEFCFKLTNTNAEDLAGAGWFDACVAAPGNNVEIVVRNDQNAIVYQGKGTKVGVWDQNQLTSTAQNFLQYDMAQHNRAITLDNGDLLRISGRNADNGGCGGSQGNGYVIMTYDNPFMAPYYDRIKLLVAPYNHTVGGGPRNFGDWTPGGELSFANDNNMYSCFPFFGQGPALTPFLGTVTFRVF